VKSQHKKSFIAAALLAGGLAYGPMAAAGPLGTLDLTFPTAHSQLFPAGGNVMTISLDNGTTDDSWHVKAGMFSGEADRSNSTFNVDTLILDEDNVLVYCVDILQFLSFESTVYDVNMIALGQVETDDGGVRRDFGRMLTFLGAINHVLADPTTPGLTTFTPLTEGDKNWLNPSAGWMAGAIQVGIWEALYEEANTGLSITNAETGSGGWFSATGVGSDGMGLLNAAFGRMGTATPLSVDQVVWLSTGEGQDLIADPVDVPVPAPLVLLVGGLGVLVMRRRRSPVASV
jgi:hypothetical protein